MSHLTVDFALVHYTGVAVNKTIELGKKLPGVLEEIPLCSKVKERLGLFAEQPELVTAEGLTFKAAQRESELALFRDTSGKGLPSISKREQILPKVETYEQARNKALEIIGEVDVHTKKPHIGKMGVCENKIVGTDWHGEKVIIRLDYDAVKGPHINVTDYRMGKGANGISIAIPFEGNEATVETLLKHLNTRANLEKAKAILEAKGDKNFSTIIQALKELRE